MLLLEIEGKKPVQVQDCAPVEKALRSLKSYGPASFAILTKEDGSYVQVAGGRLTCVVEQRSAGAGKQMRARYERAKVPYEVSQTLVFGGGKLEAEPEELLFIEDVILIFKAFWEGSTGPETVAWRDMSERLKDL
ncbi:hypothetical protein [Pannonibacter phragmitetus]|uniref:hypothetical protein n=1 Tax=Pannonibacter phragmitetus TaxID=121719 RepID=UPI000F01BDE3|nr:hypothetical protein [Pannonibacter phragmitetus]